MNDYSLFYKRRLTASGGWPDQWDVFVSAYNSSQRVNLVASRVAAAEKHWLMLPEYGYEESEYPTSGKTFHLKTESEAEFISAFINTLGSVSNKRLVIDITGFVSHYVLVLIALLAKAGVDVCDVLYGEPVRYLHSERTKFSDEDVMQVRQVAGFEGIHTTDTNNDLLILAVGYDYRLVAEVANDKEHARKVQLFGLPSLRPDMYQENLLRASKVAEAIGPEASNPHHFRYAPANDPFMTAAVVSAISRDHLKNCPGSNIYLSPLSTKVQALGFAVYYLKECVNTATSVLYPFCRTYMRETSEGLSSVWQYHVELANLRHGPV